MKHYYNTDTMERRAYEDNIDAKKYLPQGNWQAYIVGEEPQELLDAMNYKTPEEILAKWKANRALAVSNIEVVYNTAIYQGDEESQTRMSNAINGLPDDITTVPWVSKDNTVTPLNRLDLKAILLDAGTQMALLWNEGRPE